MESLEMDSAAWTMVIGMVGAVGTALAAAIKVVYTRITLKTDEQINGLSEKLDQCEERHNECEKRSAVLGKQVSYITGFIRAQGVEIPCFDDEEGEG